MTEKITKEDVERALKSKHSVLVNAAKLDVWTKFKLHCVSKGMSLRSGLRDAILEYMKDDKR